MTRLVRSRAVIVTSVVLLLVAGAEGAVRLADDRIPTPPRWGDAYADAKVEQLRSLGDAEVVLLGSSIVNGALDPDRLAGGTGTRVYNAGLPGASLKALRHFLETVVLEEVDPAVVVLGVSVRDYNDNYLDNGVRRLTRSTGFGLAAGNGTLLERLEAWAGDRSELIRKRAALREPATVLAWARGGTVAGWPRIELTPLGRYPGFDDAVYAETTRRDSNLRRGAFADFRAGPATSAEVTAMIDTVRRRGGHAVLLRMPSMDERIVARGLLTEAQIARFDAEVRRVAEETSVTFVDLSRFNDEPAWFQDYYHLNAAGIAAVNPVVLDALRPAG